MFGYIKPDAKAPRLLQRVFKKNYCMLCRAISENYGSRPRLTLSFDVTFMMLLFTDAQMLPATEKVTCFGGSTALRSLAKSEPMKKCAALNIAMAEAMLSDRLRDEKSDLARIGLAFFGKAIRKAGRDYPAMRKRLQDGYARFNAYEKENRSLEELEAVFADLITEIAREDFGVRDEYRLSVLSYVAKWLYFIDACDDLDRDLEKGTFNPLRGKFASCEELFMRNYIRVGEHIGKMKNGLVPEKTSDLNRLTADRIVYFGIPESTYKVMMRLKHNEFVC